MNPNAAGQGILAIVPARGGSKGIPRKNLADVCGRPLIAWSIETGNDLVRRGAVRRCIVSTDDAEIAEVARRHGGDVPFMRPAEFASDAAPASAYVGHALDALAAAGEDYAAVMLLQPTAPIREVEVVAAAAGRFMAAGAESLISCYREDYINDLVMYDEEPGAYLRPRSPLHNRGVRRQDHGASMVRNGALYIVRTAYFRATGRLVADRPMLMAMRKRDSVNVDEPEDLVMLRALLCR